MDEATLGTAVDCKGGQVRKGYVPAADFVSKEFAELEANNFWPRVWPIVFRKEEIPTVGSLYSYDIIDGSIIVVRTAPNEIGASHNSGLPRGRHFTEGGSAGLTYLRARL